MALESASFLEDLNTSNPVGALDQKHEGDDHLRLVKAAMKNTFPGLAGRAWRRVNKSASGPLVKNDNMTLQNAAGGITLTPSAPAVLGNGWINLVRAVGGSVTIASESNINGSSADYSVPAGHIAVVLCDGTEFFVAIMYESTPSTPPVFPAGTKMVFCQTVAPTGWTKLLGAQYNDAAIRATTGTVGTGGVDAFTIHFGPGKAAAGHTLSLSQIPSHTHSYTRGVGTHNLSINDITTPVIPGGDNTGAAGGGASHAHNLNNFDIKYMDVITAEKT